MDCVLWQLSLDLHYTEDEIYELSLAREPRGSLSSVSQILFLARDDLQW